MWEIRSLSKLHHDRNYTDPNLVSHVIVFLCCAVKEWGKVLSSCGMESVCLLYFTLHNLFFVFTMGSSEVPYSSVWTLYFIPFSLSLPDSYVYSAIRWIGGGGGCMSQLERVRCRLCGHKLVAEKTGHCWLYLTTDFWLFTFTLHSHLPNSLSAAATILSLFIEIMEWISEIKETKPQFYEQNTRYFILKSTEIILPYFLKWEIKLEIKVTKNACDIKNCSYHLNQRKHFF